MVSHLHDKVLTAYGGADTHASPFWGELPRIGQQIQHDLPASTRASTSVLKGAGIRLTAFPCGRAGDNPLLAGFDDVQPEQHAGHASLTAFPERFCTW